MVIIFLFWILINILSLRQWHPKFHPLKQNHLTFQKTNQKINKNSFRTKFKEVIVILNTPEIQKTVLKNRFWGKIIEYENMYFFVEEKWKHLTIRNITPQMKGQIHLLHLTLYLMIFFGGLSYFISRYFVKNSLKKLNLLVNHVKKLDIESLNSPIHIDGPKDDEIKILAEKINTSLEKIHQQTLSLKDFVANASHELRTPLMSIYSEIDYALKSKNYKEWLEESKQHLKQIDKLLNELLLITQLTEKTKLEKEKVALDEIINDKIKIYTKKFCSKWEEIKIIQEIKETTLVANHQATEIIFKNLIENAFKYTEKGEIKIQLDEKKFSIQDSWIGIQKENLQKIRERFWQEDDSRTDNSSFWLGLYLVKFLVEKQNWKIKVESKKGERTKFEITF